jgi:hypothetical protein
MNKKVASLVVVFILVLFQGFALARDPVKGRYDPYQPGYPDRMSDWNPGQRPPAYALPFSLLKGKDYYSFGTLVLQVAPEGVDVRLDGVSLSMPPASGAEIEIPVRRGFHTLNLSKEGYAPRVENFTILPFQTVTMTYILSKAEEKAKGQAGKAEETESGFLDLDVTPPQASVSLGPIQASTAESLRAQEQVRVPPGNYELFVSLPGYQPYIENVRVEAGKILSRKIRLERLAPAEAR